MKGQMDFTASTGDSFKIAMYDSSATLSASTTDYSTSEEITNTSGTAYTAGGEALTNITPVSSSTTAYTDFSDVSWTSASFTANAALIYNTTTGTGSSTTDSVAAIAFGGDKTVSSGNFYNSISSSSRLYSYTQNSIRSPSLWQMYHQDGDD